MSSYVIQTPRLGLRNYTLDDFAPLAAINLNLEVMKYFPRTATELETLGFIEKMMQQFEEKGYCYFAADRLDTGEFIGFIGLSYQNYESPFTPCVDIGWRLKPSAWGKGFATEGAKACLNYGLNTLKLRDIYSVTPVLNIPSEKVMQKIGMRKWGIFKHPKIEVDSPLRECLIYCTGKSDES